MKRKKKRRKWPTVFVILLIIVGIPACYVLYQIDKIQSYDLNTDNITINDIKNKDIASYRNIAIFGVDSRENALKENTRSDSIIIASINKKTKDVNLVSIYRDTYVNIDGHGYTKLGHAYAYGGPELALSTINKNFDLNITEFVTVNFSAVANVVDSLGGITLDISEAELDYVNDYTRDINKINKSNSPYLKKAGKQVVNGTQATAYSRVRYTSGGDYKRTERQRIVIGQILAKAKSTSVTNIASVANTVLPQIYTSLGTTEILGLSKDVFSYDMKEDSGFPFEKESKKIKGTSYVLANDLSANVTNLHKFLFGTKNYKPSTVVREISSDIHKVY